MGGEVGKGDAGSVDAVWQCGLGTEGHTCKDAVGGMDGCGIGERDAAVDRVLIARMSGKAERSDGADPAVSNKFVALGYRAADAG